MKGIFLRSALLVAMVLASARAAAYDFTVDGIYYNVVSLSDLTCSVTSGDEKYTGDVVIPDQVVYNNRTLTVVGISKRAFIKCTYLTSVIIGNSVTTIGNDAFSGCTGLTSVTIPNSVTTIDNFAFNGCTALKELVIEDGESVLELGYNENFYGLFHDCPLESFYLGRNLSYSSSYNDGYSPFYNIKTIKEVNIGNSVTTIGNSTFRGCDGLTNVTIPNSVTTIDNSAFKGCTALKEMVIEDGESVLKLGYNETGYDRGEGLFHDCPIESFYLGRDLSYISSSDGGYSPLYNLKNSRKLLSATP